MKMSCIFTCSTVSAKNEWGETSVFNFTNTFIILGPFNCFVSFQYCFLRLVHVTGTIWMCYSDVEERFLKGPPETSAGYVQSRIFICISCMGENMSLKVSEPVQFQRLCIRSIRSRSRLALWMTNPPSWQFNA